jgi:glycerophosphoryl diester phosphodiesterase
MTLVIAHRGAARAERENTLAAFEAAARLGADWVELDVRRTPDGALAVHHDAEVAGLGPLCRLDGTERPPWLPELPAALDVCGDAGLGVNIEVKNLAGDLDYDESESLATAVAAMLMRRDRGGAGDRVLVSSFSLATVDRVRAVDAAIPTGLLTLPGLDQLGAIETAAVRGHVALHPHDLAVTPELIAAAHDGGLLVNVWTVDDPDRIRLLAGWGVDGVVTNVPDVAVDALREPRP